MKINDKDFTTDKFVRSKMKEMTLDKQPPEIVKVIIEGEATGTERAAKKIKILVQERDFNRDGIAERIIYYRQVDNERGVPLLYIFRKENDLWSNVIFSIEGAPDIDIPELEFLTKPDVKNFDIIKASYTYGDNDSDVYYYQVIDNEYKKIECRRVTSEGSKPIDCR